MRLPTLVHFAPNQAKGPQDTQAKLRAEGASFWMALRLNDKLRYILSAILGGAIVATAMGSQAIKANDATLKNGRDNASAVSLLNGRIDEFAASCEGKGNCKTFPFTRASQVTQLYAITCFNYSAQSPTDDQPNRLKAVPGAGNTCGWSGDGSATTVAVVPNSSYQLGVPSADGKSQDATVGITGVSVLLAGQQDVLSYVVPIKATSSGVSVAAPGAFYSTPPNTLIRSCSPDTVFADGEVIRQRIQSMEAGRVRSPNIDPRDYLMPGRTIGTFGKSVTKITVKDVTVCQGSSDKVRTVVAHERFNGPTPGSHFDFTLGYVLQLTDKWYVLNWGPVLGQSTL